jgi:hypothetical protein
VSFFDRDLWNCVNDFRFSVHDQWKESLSWNVLPFVLCIYIYPEDEQCVLYVFRKILYGVTWE